MILCLILFITGLNNENEIGANSVFGGQHRYIIERGWELLGEERR